ncbi:NAD(P)-dependent alcohol dehydrogenase [Amycolatopsis sp. GM8]|uniref:NAD(P)-dependent alcohol dehydrogenase n=1 Tax=Amycolatopsis sp. GM8 TaxID=2896530 RepID=UPI001F2DCEEA|nr:NAD(P)-dependent alcohol dehydrogenase [Amycolatopsis sp. GM8]
MKAIVQDRYGSPDVLALREVDQPVPGDHEVLVRVEAASLNARDWHIMRGDPYLARLSAGLRAPEPKIRGTDFAGRVVAAGRAVTRLRPGDEVYGEHPGAFAEYVCAPDDVVDTKPANLTFEEAAAVPLAGITALMGLRDAKVGPETRVVVNGASGGVGTFAVQIAKSLGADVTAVCSTRNIELVRSLGADHIIDYTRDDFTRDRHRYDVVFDLVGNRPLGRLRRAATPAGTVILSGGGVSEGGSLIGPMGLIVKGMLLARFVRQRLHVLSARPGTADLAALRELIEAGVLVPVVDRTYPLSKTPEAVRYLEEEHARAKVIVTP